MRRKSDDCEPGTCLDLRAKLTSYLGAHLRSALWVISNTKVSIEGLLQIVEPVVWREIYEGCWN